MSYNKTN